MIALTLLACGSADPIPAVPPDPPPTTWVAPDAPSPLRRLTAAQYDNTVRDLFGGLELPSPRFPVEAAVDGFVNNASAQNPSALWVEALQLGAQDVTEAAMSHPEGWLTCPLDGGPDPSGCGTAFVADFGNQVFRRPMEPLEIETFTGFFVEELAATQDFSEALSLTIQGFLNSPQFLYHLEVTPPESPGSRTPLSDWEVANRLSYLLWNTMPDATLQSEAAAGRLTHADAIEAQALRMLDDPRAADGILDFHAQWLDLDTVEAVNLNTDVHPYYSQDMNPSLRRDVEDLVLRVWESDDPTLWNLLHDRGGEIDEHLAVTYDLEVGTVGLPPERAGFLTRSGWLAPKGHITNGSPVLRGVWVLERLVCTPSAPPPPDIAIPSGLVFGNTFTNREIYEAHVSDPACSGCHIPIDGIGFGFENYNALGMWQDTDNGWPVDASGAISLDGTAFSFEGALELSDLLADSAQVQACYGRHWFRYAHGRSEGPADVPEVDDVLDEAVASGGNARSILFAIVRSETFRSRQTAP